LEASTGGNTETKNEEKEKTIFTKHQRVFQNIATYARDNKVIGAIYLIIGLIFTFFGYKFYKFMIFSIPVVATAIILSILMSSTLLKS